MTSITFTPRVFDALLGRYAAISRAPYPAERIKRLRRRMDVLVALVGLAWVGTLAYSFLAGGSWSLFAANIAFSFGALFAVTAQAALQYKEGPLQTDFLRRCGANAPARAFLNEVNALHRPLTEAEYSMLLALAPTLGGRG